MTPRLHGWTHVTGALPDGVAQRIVHAQRARKLRRRGEQVLATGKVTPTGKFQFVWFVLRLPA